MAEPFLVESPNVTYSKDFIEAKYTYSTVHVCKENGVTKVGRWRGARGARGGEALLVPAVPSCPLSLSPGAAVLHPLHLPHGPAGAAPGGDAGGLGGQQRHHGDGGRAGQQAGAVLDDQDGAQGGCPQQGEVSPV